MAQPGQPQEGPPGEAPATDPRPPHMRPSPAPKPETSPLVDDLRRVASLEALGFAAGATAPLLLGGLSKGFLLIGWVMFWAAVAGAFFHVLDHLAEGRPGLPLGTAENLGRHLWRGLMILLVGAIPPILASMQLDTTPEGPTRSLVMLGASLVGAGLVPAATVAVYTSQSALAAFAPHLWFRIISRIPDDYAKLIGLCVAVVVLQAIWAALIGLALGSFPVLASLVYAPFVALLAVALAATFGGILDRRRNDLGW